MNIMSLVPLTIQDRLVSPLSKFITFAANDCGFSGSLTEISVTAVHPFILKALSKASKEDNHNWYQVINGPFANEHWKAAEIKLYSGRSC